MSGVSGGQSNTGLLSTEEDELCTIATEYKFNVHVPEYDTMSGNDNSKGRKEIFYLTMHSTHFIYGYMASDIWLRTILIVRKETCCCHIGYSLWLTTRVILYAPCHRQDSTYHGLCYTSRGALAGMRNSSMGNSSDDPLLHERTLLPWSYISLLYLTMHSNTFYLVISHQTYDATMGYSFRLAAGFLLYSSSHRQDNTYHCLCYTSCGALAGNRNRNRNILLSYFSFQPVFHNWCNKWCGMCYPVCGRMHI